MPRKLYLDTSEGIVEHLVFDDSERKFHLQRQSDVTENIEWNKREYNQNRQGKDGLGSKVADVPMGVVVDWKVRLGMDFIDRNHWPAILRKLDDPEWRYLRTTPGRIT